MLFKIVAYYIICLPLLCVELTKVYYKVVFLFSCLACIVLDKGSHPFNFKVGIFSQALCNKFLQGLHISEGAWDVDLIFNFSFKFECIIRIRWFFYSNLLFVNKSVKVLERIGVCIDISAICTLEIKLWVYTRVIGLIRVMILSMHFLLELILSLHLDSIDE